MPTYREEDANNTQALGVSESLGHAGESVVDEDQMEFSGEAVAIDLVLGPPVIFTAPVAVKLLQTVLCTAGQGSTLNTGNYEEEMNDHYFLAG